MVFSDLFFLFFFLPLCLLCYGLAQKIRYRNAVLIGFSLLFYAWGEPLYVFLILVTATANFFMGLAIERRRAAGKAKSVVALSLVFNLGILAFFKYTGFLLGNLNAVFSLNLPVPEIALPIGISFYTFQTISYIMDVYWGKVHAQQSYANFLMYISMFPQLVAGPIVRYETIERELTDRHVNAVDLSEGITRICVGLGKKVLIANNLSAILDNLFMTPFASFSVLGTWYAVIVFTLQVYFDFSGYSDIAIGLGRLFGFHFDENFKYPFVSKTITEYWQRWHISLGTFFRDYLLYVPILGKRRQYLSLFLVWFCTGLWHGASWNFVLWGLYFGLFIFLERLLGKKRIRKIPVWVQHIYSKLVIIIGFGIFYFEDLTQLGQFFRNLIGLGGIALWDSVTLHSMAEHAFLLAAAILLSLPIVPTIQRRLARSPQMALCGQAVGIISNVVLLATSSILLVNATNNPFLYFRW